METLSKSKTGYYASLRLKKNRDKENLFIAEGEKSISELLGTFEVEVIIASESWCRENVIKYSRYKILQAAADQLRRLSSLSTPPQVIAVMRKRQDWQNFNINTANLYLLLDGVQDPGNLGTIIRTADWFGIREVFASPSTVDIYNPKALQATMGSLARVIICYTELQDLIVNNTEMPVYGTLLDGENIYETQLTENGFIVMGNEGNGISESLRQLIGHKLLLPPYPVNSEHAESLNVGIATALIVAEFRRRILNN